MGLFKPRYIWLGIAAVSAALVAASLILTVRLNLHPCPLCIFQRLLFMVMCVLALAAFLGPKSLAGRTAGVLTLLTAISGAAVAGYQIWLQAQPAAMFTCGGANPNLIERLVDWLGQRLPSVFLATGICEGKGTTHTGLLPGGLVGGRLHDRCGRLCLGSAAGAPFFDSILGLTDNSPVGREHAGVPPKA